MCHIPCQIFGLPHSWVITSDVVHVISILVACAETCVAPFGCFLEWISRKHVCGSSTWWLYHNSACYSSKFIPDSVPEWPVSGATHVVLQHIWHQSRWLISIRSMVSTCASIGRSCAYTVHIPWYPVSVWVVDWQGNPPVVGRTRPFEFHSVHIRCRLCEWGYIIKWFPRVEYLLVSWCTSIK